jgi:hypothetical protein
MPDKNFYPEALSKRVLKMFTFDNQTTKHPKSLLASLKSNIKPIPILKLPEIK